MQTVLIIDVQQGLFGGERPVYDGEGLIERLQTLIGRAREAGVPVVYVQDKDVGPHGSAEWQIHPAIRPNADEAIVEKAYSDSFYQTELDNVLRERGTTRLIVGGCKTDACVDATVRRAIALGYDVTLVTDGHSTSDNSFLSAPQSIAYYNMVLEGIGLEDGFGNGEHSIDIAPVADISFA